MGQLIRSSLARFLTVMVTPVLALGVMAGMAPASAAAPLSHKSGARPQADAAARAAVPATLQAAIRKSLGTAASGAGYSQRAELTASRGAPGDEFGYSVALSALGTTALVGAWQHNAAAGAAYVFRLRGGAWSQTAELTAAHATPGDNFGYSVALSARGTTAVVGEPRRNSFTGAAYVFRLRGGTWSQTAQLTAAHGVRGDGFGEEVTLSALGTTALIAAIGHNLIAGAAFVFRLRGGAWSQTAELTASDAASFDAFGTSMALSALGTTALIGANGNKVFTGAAYVFRLRGGTWSQTAELTPAHAAPGDDFGVAVALSAPGTTALIGATGPNSQAGAAFVFRLRGGAWSQTAELTAAHAAPRDEFGYSVALSARGTTALAGAPFRHSATGAAYVFRLRRGTWSQTAALTASDAAASDIFGSSVALSATGATALAGAPFRHSSTGAAYVFTEAGHA